MQHDAILWYLCPPSVHSEHKMSTPKWTNHNYCPGTFSTPCPLWYRVPKTSTIRRFHVDKKCPFRSGHLCFLGGHPVDKCTIELHHAASSSQTHADETLYYWYKLCRYRSYLYISVSSAHVWLEDAAWCNSMVPLSTECPLRTQNVHSKVDKPQLLPRNVFHSLSTLVPGTKDFHYPAVSRGQKMSISEWTFVFPRWTPGGQMYHRIASCCIF